MKLAEILSDLSSLRACDASAAQALVSVNIPDPKDGAQQGSQQDSESKDKHPESSDDPDLQRAKDLVRLHYTVKMPHENGQVDASLLDARRSVKELGLG